MTDAVTPAVTPTVSATPAVDPSTVRGTPEYIAKMVAISENRDPSSPPVTPAVDGVPAVQTPAVPAMPEGGVDKFYNKATGVYNWSAHTAELNFKLAQKGEKPQQPTSPVVDPAKPADAPKLDADGKPIVETPVVPPAPVAYSEDDWKGFAQEAETTGKFTDASREKLTKLGMPKEVLDNYEAMLVVVKQVAVKTTQEYAGGADQLNTVLTWAKDNLSADETKSHNEMLRSPNWRVAIDSLKARHAASQNTVGEPKLATPTSQPSAGGPAAFTTQNDMFEAMTKLNAKGQKLYQVDEAYRNQVRQRIALSNF